ncbi:hypothetical protein EDB86DRAFT_2836585 [Lactarius hatsudake]|nr:hypothetical protein EDB86DRAFT_2836585 [Lactarius hatsudake]
MAVMRQDSYYKQTQIITLKVTLMFHKVDSIEALGRTVGSLVSGNTHSRFRPSVLYADRGVIALNKPPGLVSQGSAPGTRSSAPLHPPSESQASGGGNHWSSDACMYEGLGSGAFAAVPYARNRKDLSRLGSRREQRIFCQERADFTLRSAPTTGRVQLGMEEGPGSKTALTMWEVLAFSDKAPLSLVRLYPRTGVEAPTTRAHGAYPSGYCQSLATPCTVMPRLPSRSWRLRGSRRADFSCTLRPFLLGTLEVPAHGSSQALSFEIVAPLPADFLKYAVKWASNHPISRSQGGIFVDGEYIEGEIPDVVGDGGWERPVSV